MLAKLARPAARPHQPPRVGAAVEAFLDTADLADATRRVYSASLAAFALGAGHDSILADLQPAAVDGWFADRYRHAAPATWNRELATLRSAIAWWTKQGWLDTYPTATLERRREHPDPTRALTRRQIESLWRRTDVSLREKALWRLLYETAARANEVLGLDVADLDLASKRGRVRSKGGALEWVFWQTGTAQLLPRLLSGRTAGPVFLADRLPTRAAPSLDIDPVLALTCGASATFSVSYRMTSSGRGPARQLRAASLAGRRNG
jgi:site-specific recombinase XerD